MARRAALLVKDRKRNSRTAMIAGKRCRVVDGVDSGDII